MLRMICKRFTPASLMVILAMAAVSLACAMPFNLGSETPTAAPGTTQLAPCELPNLIGLDAKAAEDVLTGMGLSTLKTTEISETVPAGSVSSQQPNPGTNMAGCKGEVTIVVSLGSASAPTQTTTPTQEATATKTAATATTAATTAPTKALTATKAAPTQPPASATPSGARLPDSEYYDLLYSQTFPVRDTYGLLKDRWKRVVAGAGSTVASVDGELNVSGKFEFYGGGGFQHRIRVLFGGSTFGVGLKEYSIFIDYQDDQNNIRLGCTDGQALQCDWYQKVSGTEKKLTTAPVTVCSGECDIQIELDGTSVRVFANDIQVPNLNLRDDLFPTGQIGLRVDAPAAAKFTLDRIVVYDIPKGAPGKVQFREDFGGDFDLNKMDGQYITATFSQTEGYLQIKGVAKSGAYYYQGPYNTVSLPDVFKLNLSARMAGGAKTAAIGLYFQHVDKDNFYVFYLNNQGEYEISAKINGDWKTIQDRTPAAGFKTGAANILTIQGTGPGSYTILLNGKALTKMSDTTLTDGVFGIGFQLDNANDQITAEVYSLDATQ